jgi:cytochrome bd-type quinol oxidase subunit 2
LPPVSVSWPGATTVVGATLVTVGTSSTVRSAADSTTRPAALSSTRLVLAAAGTVSSSEVSDSTRNVASTPFTLTDVTALSNVPVTLTMLPGTAEVGANPEIVNGGVLGAGALLACAVGVGAALSPPPHAPSSVLPHRTARIAARRT